MKSSIKLSLIVARAKNGVIGRNGDLPWRLSDDLAFFKAATSGHPIIMGRKTWESLPRRPLPGRDNIVLTRDWTYKVKDAHVYTALGPAIEAGKALARAAGKREVFIIGGETLYKRTIAHADMLYLTEVQANIQGDAYFPEFNEAKFEEVTSRSVKADARNDHDFRMRVLKRKS